jgi:hypothetical protein
VGVHRRARKSTFVTHDPAGSARVVPFGHSVDEPVVGDWDIDGTSNVGIRKAKPSKFKLQTSTGIRKIVFGFPSDRPVAGDWDANGVTDLGVWTPATATFVQSRTAPMTTVTGASQRMELTTIRFGRPRR